MEEIDLEIARLEQSRKKLRDELARGVALPEYIEKNVMFAKLESRLLETRAALLRNEMEEIDLEFARLEQSRKELRDELARGVALPEYIEKNVMFAKLESRLLETRAALLRNEETVAKNVKRKRLEENIPSRKRKSSSTLKVVYAKNIFMGMRKSQDPRAIPPACLSRPGDAAISAPGSSASGSPTPCFTLADVENLAGEISDYCSRHQDAAISAPSSSSSGSPTPCFTLADVENLAGEISDYCSRHQVPVSSRSSAFPTAEISTVDIDEPLAGDGIDDPASNECIREMASSYWSSNPDFHTILLFEDETEAYERSKKINQIPSP